jgi:hypothetical protein
LNKVFQLRPVFINTKVFNRGKIGLFYINEIEELCPIINISFILSNVSSGSASLLFVNDNSSSCDN